MLQGVVVRWIRSITMAPLARMCSVSAALIGSLLVARAAHSAPPEPLAEPTPIRGVLVDRVVVRWYADEIGGATKARAILARQLAFEARLESLAEGGEPTTPLFERHIRAALDRHIAESLLASLPISPVPSPTEVAERAQQARSVLAQQSGGVNRIAEAAKHEGISGDEYSALLRRRARASLYLDRMIAPMLEPTERQLRDFHATGSTPYAEEEFGVVKDQIRRLFLAQRLRQAIDDFFQNARTRITIKFL